MRTTTLTDAPYTCTTSDAWYKCQGELAVYDYVLGTETSVISALDQLLSPDDDESQNPLEA